MNGGVVIRVDGLGKRYKIGQTLDLARTFRETLVSLPRFLGHKVKAVASALRDSGGDADTPRGTFWALKDVGFEVKQGEVVGIIGRNGAGKSTLLKILSRITAPTTGRAEIYGRVGSLLEVGTGFHPELTGRENIFLNGAILGMKRAEIARKFDEIVEFAEVAKFLDTPVKRYSSGMQVRLAFAVAAHLDPEILVIDEVLAVGDAEFQKKCLGKMSHVAEGGRTVLFVSHNMQAVKRLCQKGILLDKGTIGNIGEASEIVDLYLSSRPQQNLAAEITPDMHRFRDPRLEIFRFEILNEKGQVTSNLLVDERYTLRIGYRIHDPQQTFRIGIVFRSSEGVLLSSLVSTDSALAPLKGEAGKEYLCSIRLRNLFLPGQYMVDLNVKNSANRWIDAIEGLSFSVDAVSRNDSIRLNRGLVHLEANWSIE